MTTTERHDVEAAAQNARTYPRQPGVPPTYLRCDWCKGDFDAPGPKLRCTQADGHTGDHVYST